MSAPCLPGNVVGEVAADDSARTVALQKQSDTSVRWVGGHMNKALDS